MVKRSSLVALVFLVGCGSAGSAGDPTSSTSKLAVAGSKGSDPTASSSSSSSENAAEDPGPIGSIEVGDIDFIEVDESAASVPRKIRVEADCRLTDHTGLDSVVDGATCSELFEMSIDSTDPATYGCGPQESVGTLRIHLKDGRDLVRDLAADRCSVTVPSLPTHKYLYAAWMGVGGDRNWTPSKN